MFDTYKGAKFAADIAQEMSFASFVSKLGNKSDLWWQTFWRFYAINEARRTCKRS